MELLAGSYSCHYHQRYFHLMIAIIVLIVLEAFFFYELSNFLILVTCKCHLCFHKVPS